MFSWTPHMKRLDQQFRETHGGLRQWFLSEENRDREVADLAEELDCDPVTTYGYMARLALERRGRIMDLQVVEAE